VQLIAYCPPLSSVNLKDFFQGNLHGNPCKARDTLLRLPREINAHTWFRVFIWKISTGRFRITTQIYNTSHGLPTTRGQKKKVTCHFDSKFVFKLSKSDGASKLCFRSIPTAKKMESPLLTRILLHFHSQIALLSTHQNDSFGGNTNSENPPPAEFNFLKN